jgi:undecaprenyl-diphosphatase
VKSIFSDTMPLPETTSRTLALIAGLVAVFAFIAWWSGTGAGSAMDRQLLLALQSVGDTTSPRGPDWLNEAGRDLTALGSISVLVVSTVLVTGWLLLTRQLATALGMLVTIAGGITVSFMLKWGFSQPRPDLVSEATRVFTSSFPSSHAMSSLVTFVTLAGVLGRQAGMAAAHHYLLGAALLLSLVSGLSRVYLGVHWPSDVAAGWIAGVTWLLLAELARRALRPGIEAS